MSVTRLKQDEISQQIIHMYENNPNACHIRDRESRYVYINPAMRELLDLPESFNISGKLLSETPHWSHVFSDEFRRYDEIVMVMVQNATISLLVTCVFGRENTIQPYIFDVIPFFDDIGNVVGTIAEAKPCKFFSPLQYINGESPIILTSNLPDNCFTKKELDVIFFSYHRLSSKETGRRLKLSHRTVENNLQSIYQKAGEHNINLFRAFCRDIGLDCYIPHKFLTQSIRMID